MSNCTMLKDMQKRISAGEDPESVIPYHLPRSMKEEDYIELLYFAVQVLPDGMRKDSIKQTLEDLHVRRTAGK